MSQDAADAAAAAVRSEEGSAEAEASTAHATGGTRFFAGVIKEGWEIPWKTVGNP